MTLPFHILIIPRGSKYPGQEPPVSCWFQWDKKFSSSWNEKDLISLRRGDADGQAEAERRKLMRSLSELNRNGFGGTIAYGVLNRITKRCFRIRKPLAISALLGA